MGILKYINFEYYGVTGYVYSLVCFFVPNIIWQIFSINKLEDKIKIRRYLILTSIFMFYCYCAVEVFAEMGTFWNFIKFRELKGNIFLVPFCVTELTSHILNVVMFIPLGFLVPFLWSNYRKMHKVAFVGFLMSLSIEVCQLFCYRISDVNDLITNTLGSIIGFVIWKAFHSIFYNIGEETLKIGKYDPIIYILLGMLGIFGLFVF